MIESILQLLAGAPAWLVVMVLAALPVIELRGALPIGSAVYGMGVPSLLTLVVVANMIPAIVILYGWDCFIDRLQEHWPWLHRLMKKLEEKTHGKWKQKIDRYGPIALILFVAIPLPGSGVWTGALAAWLFDLNKRTALLCIFAGVVLAASVVLGLTLYISSNFIG